MKKDEEVKKHESKESSAEENAKVGDDEEDTEVGDDEEDAPTYDKRDQDDDSEDGGNYKGIVQVMVEKALKLWK